MTQPPSLQRTTTAIVTLAALLLPARLAAQFDTALHRDAHVRVVFPRYGNRPPHTEAGTLYRLDTDSITLAQASGNRTIELTLDHLIQVAGPPESGAAAWRTVPWPRIPPWIGAPGERPPMLLVKGPAPGATFRVMGERSGDPRMRALEELDSITSAGADSVAPLVDTLIATPDSIVLRVGQGIPTRHLYHLRALRSSGDSVRIFAMQSDIRDRSIATFSGGRLWGLRAGRTELVLGVITFNARVRPHARPATILIRVTAD